MTIFEADWICPISSSPIRNGRLAVDHGKIRFLLPEEGSREDTGEGHNRIRFPGCVIIPGFVNAHAHLELTILRGFLEDLSFADWIGRLTRTKYQELTRDEMLLSARLGAIDMLAAGVTCVGEVMDLGVSWQAMREFDLQGIAYQEVFGPAEGQADESLSGLMTKIDAFRDDQSETRRIGVSPHAPYTVSSKLFREVDKYAQREDLRLTTHIAESKDEGLFVRQGAGPFAERLRQRGIPITPHGCSPIAYLDRMGLLRPEMLLVHTIDLDDTDFGILRNKRPAIVHCPKSNAKLAHGVARIAELKNVGVVAGLGTDGVASNNLVDMFEEMRTAIFQQRGLTRRLDALDAQTVFRMATLDGAECLGLSKHLGSLEAGKRADFVVVDLSGVAVQPVYDPVQTMVYSASRQNVRATYLGGRETKIDPADIVHACAVVAKRLS